MHVIHHDQRNKKITDIFYILTATQAYETSITMYYSYIICAHHIATAAHSCVHDIKPTKTRHTDTGSKTGEQKLCILLMHYQLHLYTHIREEHVSTAPKHDTRHHRLLFELRYKIICPYK